MAVKTNMTAKQGICNGHTCEGQDMAYKCKIFVDFTQHFMDISICVDTLCIQFQKILA